MLGTMETSVMATQPGWAQLPPPGLGGTEGATTGLKVVGLVLVPSAGHRITLPTPP